MYMTCSHGIRLLMFTNCLFVISLEEETGKMYTQTCYNCCFSLMSDWPCLSLQAVRRRRWHTFSLPPLLFRSGLIWVQEQLIDVHSLIHSLSSTSWHVQQAISPTSSHTFFHLFHLFSPPLSVSFLYSHAEPHKSHRHRDGQGERTSCQCVCLWECVCDN